MNANLKLNLNLKNILPVLRKLQPYIYGVFLIGVFGYTAWVVNAAMNTQPDPTAAAAAANPAAKISFDKKTIASLKSLNVVQPNVPEGDLGKSDPFK